MAVTKKILQKNKFMKKTLLIGSSLLLLGSSAIAANLTTSGQISFIKSIKILEKQKLNFGTLEVPSDQIWVGVSPTGQPQGTGTFINTSTVANGIYVISGANNISINIKAHPLGTYSFMEYFEITGNYSGFTNLQLMNGVAGLTPPGAGTALNLGAKLKVAGNIQEGDYSPAFSIEVNYD